MNYDDLYYFQQEHRLSDRAIQFMLDFLADNGIKLNMVKEIAYYPYTDQFKIYTRKRNLCIRKEWLRRIE